MTDYKWRISYRNNRVTIENARDDPSETPGESKKDRRKNQAIRKSETLKKKWNNRHAAENTNNDSKKRRKITHQA